MTTFYTKKDEVSLKSGQTLGYTAGKGYYAAGTPTPPKPPPSSTPAKTSPDKSNVAPTATRPTAAKTPTTPASLERAPTTSSRTADGDRGAAAASNRSAPPTPSRPVLPKIGESTPYYTKPEDVPLKPGQTLGHETGEGYYAIGRPNPTKASSKPESSTAKVMALSSRGSTESPLKEHVETRDGKTSITLSHATKPAGDKTPQERKVSAHANERSAKPHAAAARAHTTRKASSRVDHELARTRERSPRAEVANGIHHLDDRPTSTPRTRGAFRHDALLAAALLLHDFKVEVHQQFYAGGFKIDVSVEATVPGVELTQHDGQLSLVWGNTTIASVQLHGVLDDFAKFVAAAGAADHKLEDALSGAVDLPGGTVTTSSSNGISVSISSHGVTTTIGLKFPDHYYVSTEVSEPTLGPVPVTIKSTVEFTPEEKPQTQTKTKKMPVENPAPKGPPLYSIHKANPTIASIPTGSGEGVGEKGVSGLDDRSVRLDSRTSKPGTLLAISESVTHSPRWMHGFGQHDAAPE